MKHLVKRTLASLALTIVGLASAAPAQINHIVKATIPFEFTFGGQTFAAGDYSLAQPLQNLLVLRDSRGHAIAQALTEGVDALSAPEATKLKFDNSEGQRILTEVWVSYDSSGLRLYPVEQRTALAKHRSAESRASAEGSRP